MDTKAIEQFEVINSEILATIEGGGVTLDQLNGGKTRGFKACICSPYGSGGTPNSCNFC